MSRRIIKPISYLFIFNVLFYSFIGQASDKCFNESEEIIIKGVKSLSVNEDESKINNYYKVETLNVFDNTKEKKFSITYNKDRSIQLKKPIFIPSYNDLPLKMINFENTFCFANSLEIKIENTSRNFIRIEEWDGKEKSFYFLDANIEPLNKIISVFSFEPNEGFLNESKINEILLYPQEFPSTVAFDMGAYNRHGIGLFGYDSNPEIRNYVFYWYMPEDDKSSFKNIKCDKIGRFRDGGSSYAKSIDRAIFFDYQIRGKAPLNLLLNNEVAHFVAKEFLPNKH